MARDGVFDLLILIERMNATPPLSKADQASFREEASMRMSAAFDRLFDSGSNGVRRITSADWMPPTAFSAEGSDNDLREQVDTLSRNFHTWISTGHVCPPGAAWRIAVLFAVLSTAANSSYRKGRNADRLVPDQHAAPGVSGQTQSAGRMSWACRLLES